MTDVCSAFIINLKLETMKNNDCASNENGSENVKHHTLQYIYIYIYVWILH